MANEGGGNSGLAFIVGGLVVVVGILAYLFLGGETPNSGPEINIELPAANGN